jgi:small subunit ribosomal protein S1
VLAINQEENIDQLDILKDENSPPKFEDIIDQYLYERPKRGQILEGEIETIDEDSIILDVGLKRAAIVPRRDMSKLDDEDIADLTVGDVIPIQVTKTPIGDQDLIVSIDNAMVYQSWQKAQDSLEEERLLELEVIGSNRGGLLVSFDKLEGFVPNSHLPVLHRIYDSEKGNRYKRKMRGSILKVKTIEVNPKRGKLIFSASEAKKERHEQRLQSLEVGEVIIGTAVNITNFGIFVDLGGIDGLVHLSELDWKNDMHPSEMVEVGDELEVKVIGVDVERSRVQLSRKALLSNPWEEIEAQYEPGDLVKVEITKVVDFGAFAKMPQGVQGLIHKTEFGYSVPEHDEDIIKQGSKVLVNILRIDAKRERIALSMRHVPIGKQLDWILDQFDDDNAVLGAEC